MINFNHLKTASTFSNKQYRSWIHRYLWHFFLAIKESMFLLVIAIFSLVHAVFPFVFDFKLIEWRINALKRLKEQLPNDPHLDKVDFK
jgi:hypothetical protein